MGWRINREQKMFETMSEALGDSKTANNLAYAADMKNFDAEFIAHLSQVNWKDVAFVQLGKMVNPNKTATRAVSDKLAQALLEIDPAKIADVFKGMIARAKEAAHQQGDNDRSIRCIGGGCNPEVIVPKPPGAAGIYCPSRT